MLHKHYPVKHGVRVYGPTGNPWFVPVMRRNEQNELEPVTTWQVRRSDFDKLMYDEAVARGATIVKGEATVPLKREDGSVYGVRVKMADGGVNDVHSEVLVDATGQHTWGFHAGMTSQKVIGKYDRQVAIFSQVKNTLRDHGTARDEQPDNTLIFYKELVHWAWFIPLDDEVVSVGIVSPNKYFQAKKESRRNFLLRELGELNPELARRVPDLELLEEARAIPNYSYHVRTFTGKGWLCIGDAHRFIDPVFSFGVWITAKEGQLAAQAIKGYLDGAHRDDPNPFADYQDYCERGLDKVQALIDAFWNDPIAFAFIAHRRHPADIIDLFAGRIYSDKVSAGLDQLYTINERGAFNPADDPEWMKRELGDALTP
ncbi:MAG: tryptophan 7-halogenase [Chloroflexi bacterium]|nr:tryptophan 7-halogenase [Chloroflexota bacterium]